TRRGWIAGLGQAGVPRGGRGHARRRLRRRPGRGDAAEAAYGGARAHALRGGGAWRDRAAADAAAPFRRRGGARGGAALLRRAGGGGRHRAALRARPRGGVSGPSPSERLIARRQRWGEDALEVVGTVAVFVHQEFLGDFAQPLGEFVGDPEHLGAS